ncbi:hypothetical protein [Pendulispora albinea]|uniref:Uncharacterized protein n=1 Tax=Pendulispora albinea TaxID=2741071 RepID=A0ABZ2LQL0_9BACT
MADLDPMKNLRLCHALVAPMGTVFIALVLYSGCSSSDSMPGPRTNDAGDDPILIPPPGGRDLDASMDADSGPDTTKMTSFITTTLERDATGHGFSDVRTVSWAHASRMAHTFCTSRGFASGHPTGFEDLDRALVPVVCFPNDSYVFDANQQQLKDTQCPIDPNAPTDINTIRWALGGCLAFRLCIDRGYVSGAFTGHPSSSSGSYQVVCLKETAAKSYQAAASEVSQDPDGFTNADTVEWWLATKKAAALCKARGHSLQSGYFNGEHNATSLSLACYL